MTTIHTITPCVFGTTNGFEIRTLTEVPLIVEDLGFGVTRSEVELSDQDECVKIFRLRIRSEVYTWIGLYRKCYEIGFSREGGYYGAGLWLAGITVNARLALDVVRNLADQVSRLAIENGRFMRPLSAITNSMDIPPGLVPMKEASERYLRGGLSAEATPGAYICQAVALREIVDWAQTDMLADKFRSIIIASSDSFPKGASNRLERYTDLTEVLRRLQNDVAIKIGRLEADKRGLEKYQADLEANFLAAQQEINVLKRDVLQWKEHCRMLQSQKLASPMANRENSEGDLWGHWANIAIVVLVSIILGLAIFVVYELVSHFWHSPPASSTPPSGAARSGLQ